MLHTTLSIAFVLLLTSALVVSIKGQSEAIEVTERGTTFSTTLSNGKVFPLVGLGVGNSQPFMVPPLVTEAMKEERNTILFDTSSRSANEHVLSSGIINGLSNIEDDRVTVHVVTKVWYTHLGYERTVHSVQQSFQNFQMAIDHDKVELKIHVLLNWPRCYDTIPFMDCEREEDMLSDQVKAAGAPPHSDKENAWKQSWKALEDLYASQEYPIESIGVSNFQLNDMKQFELFATVQPHILQINVWSLLYDPELITYCHTHNIHVQVYNLMSVFSTGSEIAPYANLHLDNVADELSTELSISFTAAQIVQAWLIQHDVSVIPRTTKLNRLHENSAVSIALVPELSENQIKMVAHSVEALLNGQDLEEFNNDWTTPLAKREKNVNETKKKIPNA